MVKDAFDKLAIESCPIKYYHFRQWLAKCMLNYDIMSCKISKD